MASRHLWKNLPGFGGRLPLDYFIHEHIESPVFISSLREVLELGPGLKDPGLAKTLFYLAHQLSPVDGKLYHLAPPQKPSDPSIEAQLAQSMAHTLKGYQVEHWYKKRDSEGYLADIKRFLESRALRKKHVIPTPSPGRGLLKTL